MNLEQFCTYIKSVKDCYSLNLFKLLDIDLYSFNDVSSYIKNNPQDVKENVQSVYYKEDVFFDIFKHCVFKTFFYSPSNFYNKQIFFYEEDMSNANVVLDTYSVIRNIFGESSPMKNKQFTAENVQNIVNGYVFSEDDECHEAWKFDGFLFRLQFHIIPHRQFVINLMQK